MKKFFGRKLTQVFLTFLLVLSVGTTEVYGNIVMESDSGCSVPEIGVSTTKNSVFFEEVDCYSNTVNCTLTCERLGFWNGNCATKHSTFWNATRAGCYCSGNKNNEPVRIAGSETAGNYQLNNWTLYWTGCTNATICKVTCSEGDEIILDAVCLQWPTISRICACKPEKPVTITSMCGNENSTHVTDNTRSLARKQFYRLNFWAMVLTGFLFDYMNN